MDTVYSSRSLRMLKSVIVVKDDFFQFLCVKLDFTTISSDFYLFMNRLFISSYSYSVVESQ